jgi:hypothetical protein
VLARVTPETMTPLPDGYRYHEEGVTYGGSRQRMHCITSWEAITVTSGDGTLRWIDWPHGWSVWGIGCILNR